LFSSADVSALIDPPLTSIFDFDDPLITVIFGVGETMAIRALTGGGIVKSWFSRKLHH
jgi:hypothetical protein